jgi:hypothetical protein
MIENKQTARRESTSYLREVGPVRLQKVLRGLQICRHLQPPLIQVMLPERIQAPQALCNMHRCMTA